VKADCSDPQVFVTAYENTAMGTHTLVIINSGTGTKNITIGGSGLPSTFEVFRSSATENCVKLANYSTGTSLSLPARSIVTLIAGGTALKSGIQETVTSNPSVQAEKETITLYPVPADDVMYMSIDNSFTGEVRATIFDPTGQTKAVRTLYKASPVAVFSLPVEELKPGMYMIRMEMGDQSTVRRFIKR
jgi:hypothetical protein